MDDDKKMQNGKTCGCDCENCQKGDHEHCMKPGMCTWQNKDKEKEDDGSM